MLDIIKRQTTTLSKQSGIRKYEITKDGLSKLISVKPRAQKLLIDILNRTTSQNSIDAIVIEMTYKDLGFKSYSNWKRYKNELIIQRLLFEDGNKYYVNPCFINYYSRRQKDFFFRLFNIKKNLVVMKPPALKIS